MDVVTYGEHVVRRWSGQPLRGQKKSLERDWEETANKVRLEENSRVQNVTIEATKRNIY